MTIPNTADNRALSANPDAWHAQAGRVCGGGITQPNGVTCQQPGVWGLRGYVHAYCPEHAKQRLDERAEIPDRGRRR